MENTTPPPRIGLLLLTGGQGSRLGGTKHDRPHPAGGSWGGHLVRLHRRVFGEGPVGLLGAPLPDFPELPLFTDPGEGPAVALRSWAGAEGVPDAALWWIVACDQVRWSEEDLRDWHRRAVDTDPEAKAWVIATANGRPQPLGGFLPHGLRSALAASAATSMHRLMKELPTALIPAEFPAWEDVDTEAELRAWEP